MNELLVPIFLAHGKDSSAAFAIYRPYAGHWDEGRAVVQRAGEYFIASYRLGNDTLQTVLLIAPDGELLMAENSGPTGARRLPLPGSPRSARLEAIVDEIRRRARQ